MKRIVSFPQLKGRVRNPAREQRCNRTWVIAVGLRIFSSRRKGGVWCVGEKRGGRDGMSTKESEVDW